MGLLFDLVREGVSARQAAEAYGLEIDRHGKARCPWHADKNPSLSFKGQWCRCFACNSGGSAIDLTAQLFGISVLEAAAKLNEDFRIGADAKPTQRPAGPSKAEFEAQARHALEAMYNTWADRERCCRIFLEQYGPEDAEDPEFSALLKELSEAQDMCEIITTHLRRH